MEPKDKENAPKQALSDDLKELLKQIDPTWNGQKPRVRQPIQLDDVGQIAQRQAFGPTLRVPLDLARHTCYLVAELAQETGREELARNAEALGRLLVQQFPETRPLGRMARLCKDLEVFAFMGGWDPGPQTLHAGARIYLISQRGDEVMFASADGPRSIPAGKFPASEMNAVQDIEDQ